MIKAYMREFNILLNNKIKASDIFGEADLSLSFSQLQEKNPIEWNRIKSK